MPARIRIEMLDLELQDISDDVVAVTAFFHIHLPLPDHILSHETARLVQVFRREGTAWMIAGGARLKRLPLRQMRTNGRLLADGLGSRVATQQVVNDCRRHQFARQAFVAIAPAVLFARCPTRHRG